MTAYADDLETLKSIELDEDNLDLCARHFVRLIDDPLEHSALRRALATLKERRVDDDRFDTLGKELLGFETHWKQRVLELESRARKVEVSNEREAAELRTKMAAFQLAYGEFPESAHATLSHILTTLPELDAPWRVTVEAMRRADKVKELVAEVQARVKAATTSRISIIWLKRLAELNQGLGLDSSVVPIFREILEADPGDADANFALASYYREHQQHFESTKILEEFLEIVEEEAACLSALRMLCVVLDQELNDLPAAAKHYESILEYEPADPQAIEALERHYRVVDDVEGLLGILSRRVQLGRAGDDEITELVHLSMDRLDRSDDAFRWLCEIYNAHPRPYLQTHLTRLTEVVGQYDAAVDTLLRGIDAQRNEQERLSVIQSILGFVTKLREVPAQVMELASEGLRNHPSDSMVSSYETTLVHFASQKEPRSFLEEMEASAASALERQCIARVWVAVMDYIPFTPDEWLARAQANVEVLGDDDDALEQLAGGLKGRGDDEALARVYRKRLDADIALKDESWLVDARDLFLRLHLLEDVTGLLERWTELEGAASIAWQWWAEENGPESADLPKLRRAIEVLGGLEAGPELVGACRRAIELADVSERGHFAASLVACFPSPHPEHCPPRFWLVAVAYLFESRDYDDALIRLAGQMSFQALDAKFRHELLDRSAEYRELPPAWNASVIGLATELQSVGHIQRILDELRARECAWSSSLESALRCWFQNEVASCEKWLIDHAASLGELGWAAALYQSVEALEPGAYKAAILTLSLRTGFESLAAWEELLELEVSSLEDLEDLFEIAYGRLESEEVAERLRDGWVDWLIRKQEFERGLSRAFEEPWPNAPESRSARWLRIAELRWLRAEDSEAAEACQSAMSTGLRAEQHWANLDQISKWLGNDSERAWQVIVSIFSTAGSQLLGDATHHSAFRRLLQPMGHTFKAQLYTSAASVFRAYHFDEMWTESAEFLAQHGVDANECSLWARKLVTHYEEAAEFERIIRLVGAGALLESEATDSFPIVRRALQADESLAAFVLEQVQIWRAKLSEEYKANLDRFELELRLHFLDDLPGANRLIEAFGQSPLEEQEDWLIDARVELVEQDSDRAFTVALIQEWARRAIAADPSVLASRWARAYETIDEHDSESGLRWLLDGAQLGCLTSSLASILYQRLGELDDRLYVDATRALLASSLEEAEKRELASRWLGRAKALGDWESWRSAWTVLWEQGELSWHTVEAHLPKAGEATELLSGLVLEFMAASSQFDEPDKAKRWALYYLEPAQLSEEDTLVLDDLISKDTFSSPADQLSLMGLRSRQPGVKLELLDAVCESAETHDLLTEAAHILRELKLDQVVSGVSKSLPRRRAARFYDRTQNHEASLSLWGEVLELEPGDQEATTVSIRLLSELGRFDELWSRLWPSIKFAAELPEFKERLRVLDEILDRGVSPDAQSAEFLLWRLDSVEASLEVFNRTLEWFYERKLFGPFEQLCRKGLSEPRWSAVLNKDEQLDVSIKLADALFRDPKHRPEAIGLMSAVKEVDIHRAGRAAFLKDWLHEEVDAAEWVLLLALEINRDDLVLAAYLALVGDLTDGESTFIWFEKAARWAIQRDRHDVLVDLLKLAHERKFDFDIWELLDWSQEYLSSLSADAQVWFWLVENLEAIEPQGRRHRWVVIRGEQLLKRNVADPELWNVLNRDAEILSLEPRAVELALKSAFARDVRKEPLTLIENAIGNASEGKLTWDDWYSHALLHGVEEDWLRVSERALKAEGQLRDEVLHKWLDIASHGVMIPEKRNLVWALLALEVVEQKAALSLVNRVLTAEEVSFEELLKALEGCIRLEGDAQSLLRSWSRLLDSTGRDDAGLAELLAFWAPRSENDPGILATAILKFDLSRGDELEPLSRFTDIELELETHFSLIELQKFSDALLQDSQIERGLFWDLAYRRRLANGDRLQVSGLVDRVENIEDALLIPWLTGVMPLLGNDRELEFCRILAKQRRCPDFVTSALRKLLPSMTRGEEDWFEIVQLSILSVQDPLTTEEEKVLEDYLELGGRDVRAVLYLARALSSRADYRRCIDLLEAQLSLDWGTDETSLLLALYDVYARVDSAHGMMSTLTRLLRASPADPAIHELVRDSTTEETYRDVLAILAELVAERPRDKALGQSHLSIGYLSRRFGDLERARQGFDQARGSGLDESLCLDVEHQAYALTDDLRGVIRVQREYDPVTLNSQKLNDNLHWWLRAKEAGIQLSDRDEGILIQLLERQGTEFTFDGAIASRLFELEYYPGCASYLESSWLRTLDFAEESETLVGWLEKIAVLSSRFSPEDPKWWLRRFQAQPAWPEGVVLWAEISGEAGRTGDFLELVEAEPEFHAEPYRAKVEIERAKIYLQVKGEPEVAADILEFLCDEGELDSPELNTLFETALLRAGRWEYWRDRLDKQIEKLSTDEERANLFIKAGELLYQQERRPELAEPFFLRALEIRPESPDGLAALARLYERSGNFFQAVSMLERELSATDSDARRVDVLNRMGRIQAEMLGDLGLARASYEKANGLSPNDLESLDALRAIANQEGRFQDYLSLLEVSLEATSDVIDFIDISLEAVEVLESEDPDLVLQLLERALQREENNVELRFKQACALESASPEVNHFGVWQALWPQAGALLPRERGTVAHNLALYYQASEDHLKLCEFGRLAMEFAEPGEGPIEPFLTGLIAQGLWGEVKSVSRQGLNEVGAYQETERSRLAEFFVWCLGVAHQEMGETSEAEHYLKRAMLSESWRSAALSRLVELFRREERFGELVFYAREQLDQESTTETPQDKIALFIESMKQIEKEHEIFSPLLSWALRHPGWELNQYLLEYAGGRDDKTQLVRYLESKFGEADIGSHRGMLDAGRLYEFEFKNESLAVTTYQKVLDANPNNLDALELLESLLGRRSQWRRLGRVYLNLARALEASGERARAGLLAKQTVELAQHALRRDELGREAAEYLLSFDSLAESDARLAYNVIAQGDDVSTQRKGLELLCRSGFAAESDIRAFVKRLESAGSFRQLTMRLRRDFNLEPSDLDSNSGHPKPQALSDDDLRKVLAHCLELPLGRFLRELWRVAPETLTRRLPGSYFQGDEIVSRLDGDGFIGDLKHVQRLLGASTLDVKLRPGSVEGPRVLPIQPTTLLLGKSSSLVRSDDQGARVFCLGRIIALTRPEVVVSRIYPGHLLSDVVCGLLSMLGCDTQIPLTKRGKAWADHFAKFGKSRFNNLRPEAETIAPTLGLSQFELYSQRVEEFALAIGLLASGDLRAAERGLAWVGDPISTLSTDALRYRLQSVALSEDYSVIRNRLWGDS